MKLLAHITISVFSAVVTFFGTWFAASAGQMHIHGRGAFEHDAGGNFALFLLQMVILPVPAAILGSHLYFTVFGEDAGCQVLTLDSRNSRLFGILLHA
jgi:hypothetical protein